MGRAKKVTVKIQTSDFTPPQNEVVQCYKQAIRASTVLDRAWPPVSIYERPRYYLPIIEKFFASTFARSDLKVVHEAMVKDGELFRKAIKNVWILLILLCVLLICCRRFTRTVMYSARTLSRMGAVSLPATSSRRPLTTRNSAHNVLRTIV